MDKRGISDVNMKFVWIFISILSIAAVWIAINDVANSRMEESVSFDEPFINLRLEKVHITDSGNISMVIKREGMDGNLTKIKFFVLDGKNSKTIEKETNLENSKWDTFVLTEEDLDHVVFVKEFSIAPIFELVPGNESIGEITDKFEFSNEQILENLGIASWWKFEENAKDEIGGNHGTLEGNVSFVSGKSGKAGNFEDKESYVDLGEFRDLDSFDAFSIAFWVYKKESGNFPTHQGIFTRGSVDQKTPWIFGYEGTQSLFAQFETTVAVADCSIGTNTIFENNWEHVVFSWNGTTCRFYKNAIITNKDPTKGNVLVNTDGDNFIGRTSGEGYFNGNIDEVMIFNRALTDKQVKTLYQFDLN
tara:strand:+ start:326 stop:1411 length:1086 start_codon:yes stop_codon:yes gene_type:complete